ncbi:MAG: leucine-rich repeat domain-containing protein, partial [Clostridia bacterium]|nr:leucine-rich repeat domain-containing protein [Clostridia bacterium]
YWCNSVEHYVWEEGSQVTRIGEWAFYHNIRLQEISFPETAVEMGQRALLYCESIRSLDISRFTMTEIEECSFFGCHELTEVKLPATLKVIGAKAFFQCPKIAKLELPEGLERIEMGAFGNYSGDEVSALTGNLWENYISRKDENGNSYADFTDTWSRLTEISIPSSVTFIGDFAFAWHKNVTEITFEGNGKNLKHIGAYAFAFMEKITQINLPSTLEYLGGEVEYNEKGEATGFVTIAPVYGDYSVCRLYGSVFEGCKALTSIELPACLTYMLPRMFRDCSALKSVTFANEDVQYNGSWRAFAGCTSLEYFEVSPYATLIADETFMGCTSLKEISFGSDSRLETIYNGVFMDCTSLATISLPNTLKNIGGEAFKGCTSLTSITLPENLVNIGTPTRNSTLDPTWGEVFAGTKITELYLPKNVQYVTPYAFANMKELVTFTMDDDAILSGFDIRPDSTNMRVSYTFYNDSKLQTVRLGKYYGLTLVGAPFGLYTFEGCDSLTAFEVSPLNTMLKADSDGVLFSNFTPSESVSGNALVAYPYGKKATTYVIPDTFGQLPVKQIMYYAFSGNKYIENLYISANVETISNYAFYEARNIKYIEFKEGSKIKYIQQGAFAFMSSYPKTEKGQYDVNVNPTATPLVSIVIKSTQPATLTLTSNLALGYTLNPFSYSTENPEFAIYVPAESVNAYKTADVWKDLADKIKPIQ